MAGLPQGRASLTGPHAAAQLAESQALRRALMPASQGWFISPVGENLFGHQEVTGAQCIANELSLIYVPERFRTVTAYSCRINVASAAAGTLTVVLYSYDAAAQLFRQLPGSLVTFNTATAGLTEVLLPLKVEVQPELRLFLGFHCTSAVPAMEGFYAGAGATMSRAARLLRVSTTSIQTIYQKAQLSVSGAASATDVPMIVYCSQEASRLL